MPDATSSMAGTRARMEGLTTALAGVIQGVPGVVRLQPSMKNSLSQLLNKGATKVGQPSGAAGVDGITITTRSGVSAVRIDIATDTTRSAIDVADAVQQRAHDMLTQHGTQIGAIDVNILSIEPATS